MRKLMVLIFIIIAAVVIFGAYFVYFAGQDDKAGNTQAFETVLQKVINMPELDVYFHPEIQDRKPLKILLNNVIKQPYSLTKFGQPVVFVGDEAKANKTPYIEFTRLEVFGSAAVVEFGYDIEGLSGKVDLKLNNSQWEVTGKDFSER